MPLWSPPGPCPRVPVCPVSGDISAAPSLQPSHMAPTLGGTLVLGYGGPQHGSGLWERVEDEEGSPWPSLELGGELEGPTTAQLWALGPPLPSFEVPFRSCLSWRGTGEGSKSQAVMDFPCLLDQAQAGPGGCGTGTFAAGSQPPNASKALPRPFLPKFACASKALYGCNHEGVWSRSFGLDQVSEVRMRGWGQCWGPSALPRPCSPSQRWSLQPMPAGR